MKNTYLTSLKAFALAMLVAATAAFTSCGDDDGADPDPEPEPATDSILDIINANADGDLDSLKKYVNIYPSLTGILGNDDGTYTFFAPTNTAFVNLLATPGFPSDIALINPDIIEGVLAYHVVAGSAVTTDQFTAGNELSTLYTDLLSQVVQIIDFNSDGTILTGSTTTNIEVEEGDIEATNGVMHKTASVLIPPSVGETLTPILGTNAGTILLGADFTTLAAGITLADIYAATQDPPLTTLTSILAGEAAHTVFAPTNLTFEDPSAPDVSAFYGETWYAIIAHHVVIGDGNDTDANDVLEVSEMTTGASINSALGLPLVFIVNPNGPSEQVAAINPNAPGILIDANGTVDVADPTTWANADAEIVFPDLLPSANGTVHIIGGILAPPQ